MKIAILLFDGLTALDAIGPYEVLCRLPQAEVQWVGETRGPKRSGHQPVTLVADYAIADVPRADILLVPGGFGEEIVRTKPHMLEWVRAIHETTQWTTSVCTGSLILGAAGLLKGLKATTHWSALETLKQFGAQPVSERVVEQGKIIMSAGVSAGIDMALHLTRKIAGDDYARGVQIGIEYDPQPPFDGCAKNAPEHIMAALRASMERSRVEEIPR